MRLRPWVSKSVAVFWVAALLVAIGATVISHLQGFRWSYGSGDRTRLGLELEGGFLVVCRWEVEGDVGLGGYLLEYDHRWQEWSKRRWSNRFSHRPWWTVRRSSWKYGRSTSAAAGGTGRFAQASCSAIEIPLWLPLALATACTLYVLVRHARRRSRPWGQCPHCGFDLTANISGICPECGTWDSRRFLSH